MQYTLQVRSDMALQSLAARSIPPLRTEERRCPIDECFGNIQVPPAGSIEIERRVERLEQRRVGSQANIAKLCDLYKQLAADVRSVARGSACSFWSAARRRVMAYNAVWRQPRCNTPSAGTFRLSRLSIGSAACLASAEPIER